MRSLAGTKTNLDDTKDLGDGANDGKPLVDCSSYSHQCSYILGGFGWVWYIVFDMCLTEDSVDELISILKHSPHYILEGTKAWKDSSTVVSVSTGPLRESVSNAGLNIYTA